MTESKVTIFVCHECRYMTTRLPNRKLHEIECNTKMELKTLNVKQYSKFVTIEIEGRLLIDVFI